MVYDELLKCFAGEKKSVADLVTSTTENFDMQFIWSVVSNMEEEEDNKHSNCLPKAIIVEQWIALHGHSLCNHFIVGLLECHI